MFILVIGAGLPGLTCARKLALNRHDVAVLDTQGWGLEGLDQPPIAFTGLGPFAQPRWFRNAMNSVGLAAWGSHRARPKMSWLFKRWANRLAYGDELSSLNAVAFSRRNLAELRREYTGEGTHWPVARELSAVMYPRGQAPIGLDQRRVSGREESPALGVMRSHFLGMGHEEEMGAVCDGDLGLAVPCPVAARRHLLNELESLGVRFLKSGRINRLVTTAQRLTLLQTVDHLGQTSGHHADAFVFADSSPATLHSLAHAGIHPDLSPFHRLVLQGPVRAGSRSPLVLSLHDSAQACSVVRYGDRFWALGPVRPGIGVVDDPAAQAELAAMACHLIGERSWTPQLARYTTQVQWVTPSGLPLVSGSRLPNVVLNLGHGCITPQHAWAAARRLNDLLPASRKPRLGEHDSLLSLLSYPT